MIGVHAGDLSRKPPLYSRLRNIAEKCKSPAEFIEQLDEEGLTKGALSWLFEDIKRSLESDRPAAASSVDRQRGAVSTDSPRERAEFSPGKKAERDAERKAAVAAGRLKLVKTFFSLEFVMPNGKKMGDCTGKELGQWGSQFMRLARAIGPNQTVREVFSTDGALKEFCL